MEVESDNISASNNSGYKNNNNNENDILNSSSDSENNNPNKNPFYDENRPDKFENDDESISLPIPISRPLYKSTSFTNVSLISCNSEYQQQYQSSVILDSIPRSPAKENFLDYISRPVSRNSIGSSFSTTATKDGIEGNRLYRYVGNSYPASSLVSASAPHPATGTTLSLNPNLPPTTFTTTTAGAAIVAAASTANTSQSISTPSPTPLSNFATTSVSSGDKLNFANVELHNSIFKIKQTGGFSRDFSGSFVSETAATVDDDYYNSNNYSQMSIKTTNAQLDGEAGPSSHILGIPTRDPPITLTEKIRLLDRDSKRGNF